MSAFERMDGERPRSRLADLSLDLTNLAAMLAYYAEADEAQDKVRAGVGAVAGAGVTAPWVRARIAARHRRAAAFGPGLVSPGWSLLLVLLCARLEGRPLKFRRLMAEARATQTTTLRWLDRLCGGGIVERHRDPNRPGGVFLALTDAGAAAMHDHFTAGADAGAATAR